MLLSEMLILVHLNIREIITANKKVMQIFFHPGLSLVTSNL